MRRSCAALALLAALSLSASAQNRAVTGAELARAARQLAAKRTVYDPSYKKIAYPGGEPGEGVGVCADFVVRAYRAVGVDLQRLVHEDMSRNFSAYPANKWHGQTRPDRNIDHRRVPNLMTFFMRHGKTLTTSIEPPDLARWQPGDIVVFDLAGNGKPSHIGIISDRKSTGGLPLVLHHFPPYPSEENCLQNWKIIGHFRYLPNSPNR